MRDRQSNHNYELVKHLIVVCSFGTTSKSYHTELKFNILDNRHINKKKPYDADDEWGNLGKSVTEKIEVGEVLDIQDRAITFNDDKYVRTKEEDYKEESEDFKEKFGNTAQYLKFINAHLSEKNNHLNKIIADKEKFYDDIAILNPEKITKEQLDRKNYTKLNSEDVRKVLEFAEAERDEIKDKIVHFTSQITLAKKELENKSKQVNEIKTELAVTESTENINPITGDGINETTDSIQKELKGLSSNKETEKIFGAINSLIVLLNSKNESTLNELKSVKSEFNKMKQDYENVMNTLEKKKTSK